MAGRFNTAGKYLRTWVDAGSTFIDVMMNVGIIYQAAALSGEIRRSPTSRRSTLATSRRFLVRGDASVVHEGWFDPDSGEFLRAATHQGHRSDSSWVRGQAWAIYGFGTAFQCSGDSRLPRHRPDAARTCTSAGRRRLRRPERLVRDDPEFPTKPRRPASRHPRMLQLAELLGPDRARNYLDYARNIVAQAEHAGIPRLGRGWLGGDHQALHLPSPREPRRRRERHVGRLLLRRGPGPTRQDRRRCKGLIARTRARGVGGPLDRSCYCGPGVVASAPSLTEISCASSWSRRTIAGTHSLVTRSAGPAIAIAAHARPV